MTLRLAQAADAPALRELAVTTYVAAFGSSFRPEDLAAHLERALSSECITAMILEHRVWVAEEDGRLLGYAELAERDTHWELRRLYVLACLQRRGLGSRLLEAALAVPEATDEVRLEVWAHNPDAQRLYERYGFRVTGRRSFEVASSAPTSDEVIMVRRPDVRG